MPARQVIVIATRKSRLALAQSRMVAEAIEKVRPDLTVELRRIVTRGDRRTDKPLPELGGKGLFTCELERALLAGQVDLAVHSAKDLPAEQAAGLDILCVPPRAAVNDVLITRGDVSLRELPSGAVIGTSSLRRRIQLGRVRPDITFAEIRGNIDTRIGKVRSGRYDAVVLAQAGLERAGLMHEASEVLSVEDVLPAPGQAALAVQGRADDDWLREVLAPINDPASAVCLAAERKLLELLQLGCQMPFAAFCEPAGDGLRLRALLADPQDLRLLRADVKAPSAHEAAAAAAETLRSAGADEVIRKLWSG